MQPSGTQVVYSLGRISLRWRQIPLQVRAGIGSHRDSWPLHLPTWFLTRSRSQKGNRHSQPTRRRICESFQCLPAFQLCANGIATCSKFELHRRSQVAHMQTRRKNSGLGLPQQNRLRNLRAIAEMLPSRREVSIPSVFL